MLPSNQKTNFKSLKIPKPETSYDEWIGFDSILDVTEATQDYWSTEIVTCFFVLLYVNAVMLLTLDNAEYSFA